MSSQAIWRHQFETRYPMLLATTTTGWRQRFAKRAECSKKCSDTFAAFSSKFWHCDDLSDTDMDPTTQDMGAEFGLDVVADTIRDLLRQWSENGQLTLEYYSAKVLSYIQRQRLTEQLRSMLRQGTEEDQLLYEKCLTVVAQWFQPRECVDYRQVRCWLDAAADEAVTHLSKTEVLPSHRLAARDWTKDEACKVIDAVSHVLFVARGLRGNTTEYYDVKNSFVDKVIERRLGIPILLSLIFMSIGRRLGVVLLPANLPAHFMLRLVVGGGESAENSLYLDSFDQGKVLTHHQAKTKLRQFGVVEIPPECFTTTPNPRQVRK
jgi:hypothetical protein